MRFLSSDLVRPLHFAANSFLEVLIPGFTLRRRGKGIELQINYDKNTPAIWNQRGKDDVLQGIKGFREKSRKYQSALDKFLFGSSGHSYRFHDPDFPFRYASGGTLPILKTGNEEYYCLFYREIFPVGWNIANGGSDNNEELLNPFITVERELREELVVLDVVKKKRYVFEADADRPLDQPAFAVARRVWREWFSNLDVEKFEELTIPLKWIKGPDSVRINYNNETSNEVTNCFLNINAEDFGIEIDNIAKINLSENAILCDGEIIDGHLLNNPIGLFKVDRFNELFKRGSKEFKPDIFFHNAKQFRQGGDFDKVLEKHVVSNSPSIRSQKEIASWKDTKYKYDLCPVTKRIIQRYLSLYTEESEGLAETFDVFLSFGGQDVRLAEKVYGFLKDKRKRVFFSKENRDVNYSRVIDDALDSARYLVAVSTDPQNLYRPWPEYEWRRFHMDIRCGVKPAGKIVSFISTFSPVSLPGPLRYYEAVDCGRNVLKGLEKLATYLT